MKNRLWYGILLYEEESIQIKRNGCERMDSNEWLYVNDYDNTVRYILGYKGQNTLCCIGINPSTAEPNNLDRTLQSVERIATSNGYDSFIMFNVYPVRDTIFEKLPKEENEQLRKRNIEEIIKVINSLPKPVNIWLAYGDLIDKRDYTRSCFNQIKSELDKNEVNYWHCGITKSGNPKHPLYKKANTKLILYDEI